jgi:hypothetical protein
MVLIWRDGIGQVILSYSLRNVREVPCANGNMKGLGGGNTAMWVENPICEGSVVIKVQGLMLM